MPHLIEPFGHASVTEYTKLLWCNKWMHWCELHKFLFLESQIIPERMLLIEWKILPLWGQQNVHPNFSIQRRDWLYFFLRQSQPYVCDEIHIYICVCWDWEKERKLWTLLFLLLLIQFSPCYHIFAFLWSCRLSCAAQFSFKCFERKFYAEKQRHASACWWILFFFAFRFFVLFLFSYFFHFHFIEWIKSPSIHDPHSLASRYKM